MSIMLGLSMRCAHYIPNDPLCQRVLLSKIRWKRLSLNLRSQGKISVDGDVSSALVEGGNAYGKFINAAAAPSKIYGYIVTLISYTCDGSMYGEGCMHGDTYKYPSDKDT